MSSSRLRLTDDPPLLAGFRRGDTNALAQVYDTFVADVAALVARGFSTRSSGLVWGVSDLAAQNDLIQETFLRLFSESARESYDPDLPLRPYLLRITKNLMIDRLRKQAREVKARPANDEHGVGDIDAIIEQNSPFEPPDPLSQRHLRTQLVATRQLVEQWSGEERTFYDLRYGEELAQEEVAERMGISRRRVRTLESRLRHALKRHLRAAGLWP